MHHNALLSALFTSGAFALAVPAPAASSAGDIPTVFLPLNFKWGQDHKVSTDVILPGSNEKLEIVVDQGSENFWIFGPNSIMNYGVDGIGGVGPCNVTVSPVYNNNASSSAKGPFPYPFANGYGSWTKIVYGNVAVNDTIKLVSEAGLSSSVPDARFVLANLMTQRIPATPDCHSFPFDMAIMGIAPYTPNETVGPSIRYDLLTSGTLRSDIMSMWFDEPPASVFDANTGGALFGGVETSKFTGPLVKIERVMDPGTVGYYTRVPRVSSNGKSIPITQGRHGSCLVDSGTKSDSLPYSDDDAFYAATGLTKTDSGSVGYPGPCESIPRDLTIDLEFDGLEKNQTVTIKIPVRNYVKSYATKNQTVCALSVENGGDCLLGAPFATGAFFAAHDATKEIALAQGGVSKRGEGVNAAEVVESL